MAFLIVIWLPHFNSGCCCDNVDCAEPDVPCYRCVYVRRCFVSLLIGLPLVVFQLSGSCASTQVLMAFTWICAIVRAYSILSLPLSNLLTQPSPSPGLLPALVHFCLRVRQDRPTYLESCCSAFQSIRCTRQCTTSRNRNPQALVFKEYHRTTPAPPCTLRSICFQFWLRQPP